MKQALTKPGKLTAASTAMGLSLLFFAVYGGCNWITAQRHDLRTWYYEWERFLPFVPLLIVPYMSMDLFFVAAPFLCRSRLELRTLARRIAFAIIVAGACFLLIPLRMAVSRPQPPGWPGAIFKFLHGFDQPFNLFPSLHIALLMILAGHYARHTRGIARVAMQVWFGLIGISTLLTGQHHLVDLVGGFVLGAVCQYWFREAGTKFPAHANRRVGVYYALGCLVAATLAVLGWPWAGILFWPACAMAVAAAGYWGLGSEIYQKVDGRLSFPAGILLAPLRLGQYLSLRHYRRQSEAWNEVTPRVWLGAQLGGREVREAVRRGVTAVLDLTAEFSEPPMFRRLAYCNLPVLDLTEVDTGLLREAADFIAQHSARGVVYVHCKAGYSRGAAAVGAWLLASGSAGSVEQALQFLRRVRPGIVLRPEVADGLAKFEATQGSGFRPAPPGTTLAALDDGPKTVLVN